MSAFRSSVMALAAGGLAAGLLAFVEARSGAADAATESAISSVTLKPVSDFDNIKDKNERAIALFQEAGKVIQSPRCMNCHPAGERPSTVAQIMISRIFSLATA